MVCLLKINEKYENSSKLKLRRPRIMNYYQQFSVPNKGSNKL